MNTQLLALLLVLALMGVREISGQEPNPNIKPELAPLARFVGTWEKQFTITSGDGAGGAGLQKKTGTQTGQWILNGQHLQESGRDSDGTTYMSIYSHDAMTKEYRLSFFQSTGQGGQMTGQWNAESNTFTWRQDLSPLVRLTATYQFLNSNEFKFQYVAKQGEDDVLFRIEGTAKRTENKNN